jgi:carbamoylphosphate synthase large subunit
VQDGIQAVRHALPRCWFDDENCGPGIEALRQYQREYDEDKKAFRQKLQDEDLCPMTWFQRQEVKLPCIVRPKYHHQGRHLYVATTQAELDQAIGKASAYRLSNGEWYASEIVKKVAEYRVFVVQGRVVCVARKYPRDENAIAWNVFQGGKFVNVNWTDWPLKACKEAIKVVALCGLDFGGVDIMIDDQQETYTLEVNSAPSLTSPYRQQAFAKAFDHIVRHGKGTIPLTEAKGGYKKFIHPAVCEQAILVA